MLGLLNVRIREILGHDLDLYINKTSRCSYSFRFCVEFDETQYAMKIILLLVFVMILGVNEAARNCINGAIANDTCICFPGWMGEACDRCGGRIR